MIVYIIKNDIYITFENNKIFILKDNKLTQDTSKKYDLNINEGLPYFENITDKNRIYFDIEGLPAHILPVKEEGLEFMKKP